MLLPAGNDMTSVEMTFGDWVQLIAMLILLVVGVATFAFYVVGGANAHGKTPWQRFKDWVRSMWNLLCDLDGL